MLETWTLESNILAEARNHKKTEHALEDELDDYRKILAKAKQGLSVSPAPAMPCEWNQPFASNCTTFKRQHQEHWQEPRFVSADLFAMAHTPVSIKKTRTIPEAMKALDGEWDKRFRKKEPGTSLM